MKSGLILFVFSLCAVACTASSSEPSSEAKNDLEWIPSCFSPRGFEQDPKEASIAGGGATPLETVTSMTLVTVFDDTLVITFPEGTKSADTLDVTLPSADLTIEFKAQRDHSDFLSPVVTFVPSQGHIACGITAEGDYRCNIEQLVLTPIDAANIDTCPSDVLPTISLGFPVSAPTTR
jgi:hypothetical protein